jgi:uncharacterized protein (TIGR02270 family)
MNHPLAAKSGPDSMVLADIVALHAAEGAFLWHQRDAAARSPGRTLEELRRLDDRVDAHLDGLRIAGDAGHEIARAALVRPGAGEVFVATVLAVERADVRALAEALSHGARSPGVARGIVSGLGWAPLALARRFLDELLAHDAPPTLHHFGIAGSAVHRHDPGAPLATAATSTDPRLRARALRAIGELGRVDLLPELRHALESDEEACRFWAAWSAALLGEPVAFEALFRLALGGGPFAERAASLGVRHADPAVARARVHEVEDASGNVRAALAGAAGLGDPALVPWVIDRMEAPSLARFAGWALSLITGCDLASEALSGPPPEGFRSGPTDDPADPNVAPDPDERLPWPDVAAAQAWWGRRSAGLPGGRRLLLGATIEPAWLGQVLRAGSQSARAAAALEIALTRRGRPLFEVRAPAFRQAQALSEA